MVLVPGNMQRLLLKGRAKVFPCYFFRRGDDIMKILIITFISYLLSGIVENGSTLRLFLTVIFTLAGIIGIQVTKSFVKEMRENK